MDPQEREELSRLIREQERLQNELSGLSGRLRELEKKLGEASATEATEELGKTNESQVAPTLLRKTPPPIPETAKKDSSLMRAKLKGQAGPASGKQAHADDESTAQPKRGVQAPADNESTAQPERGVQAPADDESTAQPERGVQAPSKPMEPTPGDWELNLGKVWFVRLGVGLVLTGLVFLSLYAYKNWIFNATAMVKVSFFFTISLSMVGGGYMIETWRKHLRQYGQVLSAGGLAAGYYTIYAAHFVPALQIIGSPIAAAILLCLWAGGMLVYSAWRKGRILAVMSIGLAYYGTVVNPSGWISLFSSLVLSSSALFLLLRFRWVWVGAVGLIAAYLSHAFWASMVSHEVTETVRITYLTCTWLLFSMAMQAPQSKVIEQPLRRGILGINNVAYWGLLVFHIPKLFPELWYRATTISPQPHEHIGWISICLGVIWMLIGALTWMRGGWRREYALLWSFQGLLVATLGLMIEAGGYTRFLMLACESCILLLAARWMAPRGTRLAAILCYVASLVFCLLERFALLGDPRPHWLAYLFAAFFGFAFVGLMRRDVDAGKEEDSLAFYGQTHRFAPLFFAWMPWAVLILGAMLRWDAEWTMLGLCGTPLLASGLYWLSRRRETMDIAIISPFVLCFGGLWILESHRAIPNWGYAAGTVLIAAYWLLAEQLRQQLKELSNQDSGLGTRWIEWIAAAALAVILAFWLSTMDCRTEAWVLAGPLIAVVGSVVYVLTRRYSLALLLGLFHIGAIFTLLVTLLDMSATKLISVAPTLGILLHLILLELRFPKTAKASLRPWAGIGIFIAFGGFLFAADWREPELWMALSSAAWLAHSFRVRQAAAAITGGLLPLFLISIVYAFDKPDSWLAYLALAMLPAAALMVSQLKLNAGSKAWAAFRRVGGIVGLLLLSVKLSRHVSEIFHGNGQAIVWGLYAVLLFSIGLVLADKLFRRFGLFYLLIALLHILVVDVMKLDTLGRILSFLTLGAVLLLLGFLYNQFQDKIRKYL